MPRSQLHPSLQQINLYKASFQPLKEPLMALHIALVIIFFMFALMAVSVYSAVHKNTLAAQLQGLQREQQALENSLVLLRAQSRQSESVRLDAEVEKLQIQLQRRQSIRALIYRQNLGNSRGFSAQLQSLSKHALDDLSLDAFSLTRGGGYFEMSGWTRKSESVPHYLQLLRQSDGFEGVGFGVLMLEQRKTPQRGLYFKISEPHAAGNGATQAEKTNRKQSRKTSRDT